MRILAVEDEPDLVSALRTGLGRAGFAVDGAATGAVATEKLATTKYDAMVLDLTLPDVDGRDLCRGVRSGEIESATGPGLRILMLTARSGLRDRVTGLDLGADDYLTKPFAMTELAARLRALLRRDVAPGSALVEVGDLVLDASRHRVTRGDVDVPLTRKEFGALHYLMSRADHVIPAEELLEHVWDENADPFTETVRVTVGNLRRKLGATGGKPLIETVIGRGYRLRARR